MRIAGLQIVWSECWESRAVEERAVASGSDTSHISFGWRDSEMSRGGNRSGISDSFNNAEEENDAPKTRSQLLATLEGTSPNNG